MGDIESIPPDIIHLSEQLHHIKVTNDPLPAAKSFGQIAEYLRDEQHRDMLEDISHLLDQGIELALANCTSVKPVSPWWDLAEQAGRACANFVADNDKNRDAVAGSDYLQGVFTLITSAETIPCGPARSIAASLLNLTADGHEPLLLALASDSKLIALLRWADAETDLAVVKWIWTVVSLICDIGNPPIPTETAELLLLPLQRDPVAYLEIIEIVAETIDSLSNKDGLDKTHLTPRLLDFVEHAENPNLAAVKGKLIHAIVEISVVTPPEESFWQRMRVWMTLASRDDLQSCAVLCYGNQARDNSSARTVLAALSPSLVSLMRPSAPVLLQHALIGLLRNLSVPSANREHLTNFDLPSRFLEMGVWAADRDMLGSIQGGAIVIVKNMTRDNSNNSLQFLSNTRAVEEILAIMVRTDDDPTRFEATRIFVNLLRCACTCQDIKIDKCADSRVISSLCLMLRDSKPYPVLSNESVLGLALLAAFGPLGTSDLICRSLGDAIIILCDLLTGQGEEIRSNTLTLLKNVGRSRESNDIKAAVIAAVREWHDRGLEVTSEVMEMVLEWGM